MSSNAARMSLRIEGSGFWVLDFGVLGFRVWSFRVGILGFEVLALGLGGVECTVRVKRRNLEPQALIRLRICLVAIDPQPQILHPWSAPYAPIP